MKRILLFILLISHQAFSQELLISNPVSFLALGDSYTIGQGVAEEERWPEQLAERLRGEGMEAEVEIIATTGWTTRDLINGMDANPPEQTFYNLVSLLIGVNNQFQRRTQEEYRAEFEQLLIRAINLARGETSNVLVLSIPDYAFTPFGQGFSNVSDEIDQFNAINKSITASYQVSYIDITDISRRGLDEPELVANDGLHPSGLMYTEWVQRIMERATLNSLVTSLKPELSSQSNIYPNPASDYVTIPSANGSEIMIYSYEGRLIKRARGKERISLKELPSGTYLLKWDEGLRTRTESFIKL